MKTKKLIELLKQGVKPIVKFTTKIEEIDSADPGMLGRVIASKIDIWERGTEVAIFTVDLSEFVTHNRSVAQVGWYDENSKPTLIWHDSAYYPKDHKEDIHVMLLEDGKYCDLDMFEITNLNPYFEEFLAQEEIKEYVIFLENKLEQCTSTKNS